MLVLGRVSETPREPGSILFFDVLRERDNTTDSASIVDNMQNVFLLSGEEERSGFAQKHQRPQYRYRAK